MALERYSVELQAELGKFLSNVNAARESLGTIQQKADDIAKNIVQSFQAIQLGQRIDVKPLIDNVQQVQKLVITASGQISDSIKSIQSTFLTLSTLKFPQNISDFLNLISATSSGLDTAKISATNAGFTKLAETIGKVNTVIVGAGGVVSALSIFRELLVSVETGTLKSTTQFVVYSKSLQDAVATFSPLLRNLGTFGIALDKIFTLLVSNTDQLKSFINVLNQLSALPGVSKAISFLISGIDSLGLRIKSIVNSFATFQNSLTNIPGTINTVINAFKQLPNTIASVQANTALLSQTFTSSLSSITQLVPGLSSLTNALASTGAGLVSVAGPLSSISPLASTAASILGGAFLAATVAVQASLLLLAKALTSVGEKILQFNESSATAAAENQLQFRVLQAEIQNTEEVLNISQGSIESWTKVIEELSQQTGFSQSELARVAGRFVQLSQNVRLSEQQLFDIVKTTALVGLEVNDLDRALKGTTGAFLNEATAIRQLTGANVLVGNVINKVNETIQKQGLTISSLDRETLQTIKTTEIFNEIQRSAAGNAIAIADSQNNLIIATNRLNGATQKLNVTFGSQSQTIFATLRNTLADLISGFADAVPSIIGFAGLVSTATGALLKLSGIALGIITTIGLLSIAFKSTNLALSGTIAGFNGFNVAVNKIFTSLLGTATQINSIGSLIRATFTVAINTVIQLTGRLTSLSGSVTTLVTVLSPLKTLISGLFVGFFTELRAISGALIGVVTGANNLATAFAVIQGTTAGAIASFTLLIGKALLVGQAFTIVFNAVQKVFDSYAKAAEGQTGLTAAIIRAISITGLFNGIINTLAKSLAFATDIIALGLSVSLVALLGTLSLITTGISKFLLAFSDLPIVGKLFEATGNKLKEIGVEFGIATDTAIEATDALSESAIKSGAAIIGVGEEVKKVTVQVKAAGQQIEESLDPQVAEGVAQSIVKIFNAQIDGITKSANTINKKLQEQAELRTQLVNRTITDTNKQSAELLKIEQDRVINTVKLEQERLDKTVSIINQRAQFEQDNLAVILGKESQNATKRIEEQQRIVGKSREAEQAILSDVLKNLEQQLNAVRKQQSDRIEVIQSARQKIKDIESGLNDDIQALRLRSLDEDKKQIELRKDIALRISEINKSIAQGNLDDAKSQIERTKGLISQLSTDPTIAQAIQQASQIAFAKTQADVGKVVDVINESLTKDLPDSVKLAAEEISKKFSRVGDSLLVVKDNAGLIESTLRRIGELQGLQDQEKFIRQIGEASKNIQEQIIQTAQQGLKSADQLAKEIQSKIDNITKQLQTSLNEQNLQLEVIANFGSDSVKKAVADMQSAVKNQPIEFSVKVDPDSIDNLTASIETAVPLDKRTLNVSTKLAEGSQEKLQTELKAISLQKEINALLLPDTKSLDEKISQLNQNPPTAPLNLKTDNVSVAGKNAVPFANLQSELSNIIGELSIESRINLQISQEQIDEIQKKVSSQTINVHLAVPDIDIPGGSIHPLTEAGGVIADVITPDSPVSIKSAMENGIFIPGVGTAEFSQAGDEVVNTISPNDPIFLRTEVRNETVFPGGGTIPFVNTADEIKNAAEPKEPVQVQVAVDEESLDRTSSVIREKLNQAVRDVGGGITNSLSDSVNNAIAQIFQNENNLKIINDFVKTNFGSLSQISAATKTELDAILSSFRFGIADASSTLNSLIDLRKQESLNVIETNKQLDEARKTLFTTRPQVTISVPNADIPGGSIHPLDEAADVINKVLTPTSPVISTVSLDTDNAVNNIKNVSQNFGQLISTINSQLSSAKNFTIKTNVNDVIDQLNFLARQSVTIPVNLKANNIDIQGGSPHLLTEAAEVFKRILTPDNINVGLNALTAPVQSAIQQTNDVLSTQQAGQQNITGNVPNRTVRIDLNIDGQSFPVDTSDAGAKQLENFSKSLQKNIRANGEYISPFSRSFTG